MQKVRIILTGTKPLLMHADTTVDVLSAPAKAIKAITSKGTKKTDSDIERMGEIEFHAGLYLDDHGTVVVPGANIFKALIDGGRLTKSGPKIERGLTLAGIEFPLIYDGPQDAAGLYANKRFVDRRSVGNQRARVMRVRPIFREWAVEAEGYIDPAITGVDSLADIAHDAGNLIGLGDYRKAGGFGRFDAQVTAL